MPYCQDPEIFLAFISDVSIKGVQSAETSEALSSTCLIDTSIQANGLNGTKPLNVLLEGSLLLGLVQNVAVYSLCRYAKSLGSSRLS